MSKPRVFEEGAVTLVLGQGDGDCSLFVGANEVDLFESVSVKTGPSGPEVLVRVGRSHDPEVDMRIEETVRTLKAVPWVTVER